MRSVEIKEFVHSGGTKDYILVVLKDSDGIWALMRRNGSRDAMGQMQRASVGSPDHVSSEIIKEENKRFKKGYSISDTVSFTTLADFEDYYRGSSSKWSQPGSKIHSEIFAFFSNESNNEGARPELSEADLAQIEAERDMLSEEW